MKPIHLLTFILFSLGCIAQGEQKLGWKTWNSSDQKISVKHPSEWIEWKLNSGEVIAFMSPKDSNDDHYPDMLVIRDFPNIESKNLDQLKECNS